MMQPPIPSPEATCPNCGQPVENAKSRFCSACGASLRPGSSGVSGWKIFGAICLGLLALPLAGMGACFLLFSGLSGTPDWQIVGVSAAALLFAALCVWGIVKLVKR